MKVLTFDLYGDFAHFRKYFTTTSPLTFSFPPPPTISGILGAIYGISKNENQEVFGYENCKIALQIRKPVKKIRMGLNFIYTKNDKKYFRLIKDESHQPRTQIRAEFVKSPIYRIFVAHEDSNIFQIITEYIQSHRSFYTVSLGLSELLADFRFVGVFEAEEIKNYEGEICTVVPKKSLGQSGIELEANKKYFKDKMPIKMNKERVVEIYDDIIYEPDAKCISGQIKTAYKLENGGTIVFF